jgi:histidine triad (HIT) family protein
MPDCIFCKIIAGQVPTHRVYEDARVLAFMDAFPVADGHVLVIPKAHAENLFETPAEDLQAVIAVSRRIAHAIRLVLSPDGLMVFQLNGAAAGQSVFHYHMHLLPRMEGTALALHVRTPGDALRLAELAERLSSALR